MKLIKFNILLLLMLCCKIGFSQTYTYELNTTISLKEVNDLDGNNILGIKKLNNSSTNYRVYMYYTPYIEHTSKNALLFGCENNGVITSDNQFVKTSWVNSYTCFENNDLNNLNFKKFKSKQCLTGNTRNISIESTEFKNRIKNAANLYDNPDQLTDNNKNADIQIPVTIKLISNVPNNLIDLEQIILPGKSLLKEDFLNVSALSYAVNGNSSFTQIHAGQENNLDLKMGDKITFRVSKTLVGGDTKKIAFNNLPGVWVARFAWDCMYYFTQSVNPGDFKPFIPFDAVVHSIMFERFADYFAPSTDLTKDKSGYKINEDDWQDDGIFYTWTYTVPARMDKAKSVYKPVINWQLYKPTYDKENNFIRNQRDDQRRGLNIAMLNKWSINDGVKNNIFPPDGGDIIGDFANYRGYDYELGADTDELQYLGQVSKIATGTLPSTTKITALKLNVDKGGDDTWKDMMPEENKQTTPESTAGYTKSTDYKDNLALSYMVTAYQRNRNVANNKRKIIPQYQGFEIEDEGLIVQKDGKLPDGSQPYLGTNDLYYYQDDTKSYTPNKLPGQVTLTLNGTTTIKININATAPVAKDNGFYGSLNGTSWPAYYQKQVPYTFVGLKNLSDDELKKYRMVMEYENGNGFLIKTAIALTNVDKMRDVKSSGKWTEKFDIESFGHYNLSVYYKTYDGLDSVIVAGKEISPIKLRFLAVNPEAYNPSDNNSPKYDGARGDGYTWYKQDYYQIKDDKGYDYATPQYGWYLGGKSEKVSGSTYLREYAFPINETVKFSIMDSDPHTFRPSGTEFYKSNRAKAHRIPTDSLGNRDIEGYIKWSIKEAILTDQGINEGTTIASDYGMTYAHTFGATPGLYIVEANYRGKSTVKHIIRIVSYNYNSTNIATAKKGEIKVYDLSEDQKKWLGFQNNDNSHKVLSVENVLSKYTYIDGPRETVTINNTIKTAKTYDKYNDYKDVYNWKYNQNNIALNNNNYINSVMKYGNSSASSIEESGGYPAYWFRHAPSYDDITDVDQVNNVNWVEANNHWQIPLTPGLIGTKLNAIATEVFEPWNLTLPWIATTSRHGYRIRANIKCFFSAKEIFDNVHGAFTGRSQALINGQGEDINSLNAKAYDDDQKTFAFDLTNENKAREAFYHDLVNNRKVIVSISDLQNSNSITVKHVDVNGNIISTVSHLAPPVLTASTIINGESTLNWTFTNQIDNPVSSFKVYKTSDLNCIATLTEDVRSYKLTGLSCNSNDQYKVLAFNTIGVSTQSNEVALNKDRPSTPTNFRVTGKTSHTIKLAWDPSNFCSSIDTKYSIDVFRLIEVPNGYWFYVLDTTINTSNTNSDVTELDSYTRYKFELKAIDTRMTSNNTSHTVSLTESTLFPWVQSSTNQTDNLQIGGETGFMLYPNPVTGNEIKVNAVADQAPFSIRNALGQVVLQGKVAAGSISVASLSAGVYFLEVSSKGQPIVAKFIKN